METIIPKSQGTISYNRTYVELKHDMALKTVIRRLVIIALM